MINSMIKFPSCSFLLNPYPLDIFDNVHDKYVYNHPRYKFFHSDQHFLHMFVVLNILHILANMMKMKLVLVLLLMSLTVAVVTVLLRLVTNHPCSMQ